MSTRKIYELTTQMQKVRSEVLMTMISDPTLHLKRDVVLITVPTDFSINTDLKVGDYVRAIDILEKVLKRWEDSVKQIRFLRGELGCESLISVTNSLRDFYNNFEITLSFIRPL